MAGLAGPGFERVFPTSGGSEAIEAAIKFARQYKVAVGEGTRWKVIGREPSYHGNTLGAFAAGGDAAAREIFGPLTKTMPKVPAPLTYRPPAGHDAVSYAEAAAAALDERIRAEGPETVLAFILEPVGGVATGALVAPASYYATVRNWEQGRRTIDPATRALYLLIKSNPRSVLDMLARAAADMDPTAAD